MELKYNKDELLFAPIGGAGEIGLNCYLYHYKGKWLIVDLGIGFADDRFPGIDILIPNTEFIASIRNNIIGMVITHAHEDHIGGVAYLWPEIKCPIYATKFTHAVLKAKLAEVLLNNEVTVHEVKENSRFEVGPFDIELIHLTHSIAEMSALMIRTKEGNIFHTGDWKFDNNPIIGEISNEEKLKNLGDEGILAMVCDSTNIFSDGHSGSEGELQNSLRELIGSFKKNLVVVTTFASNLARLHAIATAAQDSDRRVAIAGKSLWRMYEAARHAGYLDDLQPFLTDNEMKSIDKSKLLLICTGCQGEPFAVTNKLAQGIYPTVKVSKGDAIIFSSKIIPGNDKKIFNLFNKFCKLGVEVLTERDHFVHVSGHPCRDEVAKMYKLLRPQISIPVHGEIAHIHEHAKFALIHGAKKSIEMENGNVLKIASTMSNDCEIIGSVPSEPQAIDGNYILPSDSHIIKTRRRLRDNGAIVATLLLTYKGKLVKQPSILTPGVLDQREDREIIDLMIEEISESINGSKKYSNKELEKSVENTIRRIIKTEVGKEPYILVQIERV